LKVRVFAPAFLKLTAIDDDGYITLEEGATINSLYRKLHVSLPIRPLLFCSINLKSAKLSSILKDGDTVSILAGISGG